MNAIATTDKPAARDNRHIVDQLADVRATIKALSEREDELKARISAQMAGQDALGGDEFIAVQSVTERRGAIDEAALKAAGVVVPRKAAVTVYSLRIERRADDEHA